MAVACRASHRARHVISAPLDDLSTRDRSAALVARTSKTSRGGARIADRRRIRKTYGADGVDWRRCGKVVARTPTRHPGGQRRHPSRRPTAPNHTAHLEHRVPSVSPGVEVERRGGGHKNVHGTQSPTRLECRYLERATSVPINWRKVAELTSRMSSQNGRAAHEPSRNFVVPHQTSTQIPASGHLGRHSVVVAYQAAEAFAVDDSAPRMSAHFAPFAERGLQARLLVAMSC